MTKMIVFFMVAFVYTFSPKWTVYIKDQAAHFVQSDLDLHWLTKLSIVINSLPHNPVF